MNAYVDTSVLLRKVLGETGALRQWSSIKIALSSELIVVEAQRTIDRARLRLQLGDDEVANRRGDILQALGALHLAKLNRAVLDRAAEPFPTVLGTLDAIHLATAILLRETNTDLVFATHDAQLAIAARSVGFSVIGVAK